MYNFTDAIQLIGVKENLGINKHVRFKLDPSPFVTLPSFLREEYS